MRVGLIYDFRQHPDCMAVVNNLRSAENPLIDFAKANGQVLFPWNVREKRNRPNHTANPIQGWIDEARRFLAGRDKPDSEYAKIVGAGKTILATMGESDPIDPLFVLSRKYPLELADYVVDHPTEQHDPIAELAIGPGWDQDWQVSERLVPNSVILSVGQSFVDLFTKAMRQVANYTFQGYLDDPEVLTRAILEPFGVSPEIGNTQYELQDLMEYDTAGFAEQWAERIHTYLIHLGQTLYATGYKRAGMPAVWFCPDTGEVW